MRLAYFHAVLGYMEKEVCWDQQTRTSRLPTLQLLPQFFESHEESLYQNNPMTRVSAESTLHRALDTTAARHPGGSECDSGDALRQTTILSD